MGCRLDCSDSCDGYFEFIRKRCVSVEDCESVILSFRDSILKEIHNSENDPVTDPKISRRFLDTWINTSPIWYNIKDPRVREDLRLP